MVVRMEPSHASHEFPGSTLQQPQSPHTLAMSCPGVPSSNRSTIAWRNRPCRVCLIKNAYECPRGVPSPLMSRQTLDGESSILLSSLSPFVSHLPSLAIFSSLSLSLSRSLLLSGLVSSRSLSLSFALSLSRSLALFSSLVSSRPLSLSSPLPLSLSRSLSLSLSPSLSLSLSRSLVSSRLIWCRLVSVLVE